MATLTGAIDRTAISVRYECRVLTLICEGEAVVGAIFRQDGEIKALRARRGVVLCAGGFIMNSEMVAKYAPRLKDAMPVGNPGDTGAGILMGLGAGGETINMHEGFVSVLWYPPGELCKGVALLDFSIDSGVYYPAFTFGGLNTTADGEVLRATGIIIPGLYAAGRVTAGLPRCAEGYASGMSIGDATFFGRRAGKAAALNT